MKKRTYKVEKSTNKKDFAEIYCLDDRKGFYRFLCYIPLEQVSIFIMAHSHDEVLLKFPSCEVLA